jgi:hypothetical protein
MDVQDPLRQTGSRAEPSKNKGKISLLLNTGYGDVMTTLEQSSMRFRRYTVVFYSDLC